MIFQGIAIWATMVGAFIYHAHQPIMDNELDITNN